MIEKNELSSSIPKDEKSPEFKERFIETFGELGYKRYSQGLTPDGRDPLEGNPVALLLTVLYLILGPGLALAFVGLFLLGFLGII